MIPGRERLSFSGVQSIITVMDIALKRIYDRPEPDDGLRILVDRLWPRGVAREDAQLDLWLKEVAPSHELRKWYRHDPKKWDEFKKRYFAELDAQPDAVNALVAQLARGRVTLLFSSKEPLRNNAVALKAYLERGVQG